MDDVIISKVASLQRCVARARSEYSAAEDFANDFTHQDAAILNILRACEQAIDIASHLIRVRKLGIPADSRDAFALLAQAGLIPNELSQNLERMVGFRNIVTHTYQKLEINIVVAVIHAGLDDLLSFADIFISHS